MVGLQMKFLYRPKLVMELLWFAFLLNTTAQTRWTKGYQINGNEGGGAFKMEKTSDGNYTIYGQSEGMFILKIDVNGNKLWEKHLPEYYRAFSGQETSDGGYILCGEANYISANSLDLAIVKTDSEGNVEWDYTYIGPDRSQDIAYDIIEVTGGGYVSAGKTELQMNLRKFDASGIQLWSNTYKEGDMSNSARGIVEMIIGGFMVCGVASGEPYYWVINEDGSEESGGELSGGPDLADLGIPQIANSIIMASDSSFIMTGNRFPDTSNHYNKFDLLLQRVTSGGARSWFSQFGTGWASHDEGLDVKQTTDGGFIVVGYTKYDNLDPGNLWLIKTDENGQLEWEKTSDLLTRGNTVVEAYDGGYLISGQGGEAGF